MNQPAVSKRQIMPRLVAQLRQRWMLQLTVANGLVLGAILVGTLLRFVDLTSIPPALNQDEVVSGYDAYSLFLTGRDHHGHPFPFAGLESFGDWASPLLTFLTILPVGLFGLRAEIIRMVSATVGALMILILYWLGVVLFGRRSIGVMAAWFGAISPWHVHTSRFAIPPSIVPTMIALTILALAWTVQRRNARGIVALALIAGLTIASYPTMKLYVPLLLLAGFAIYWRSVVRVSLEAICYAAVVFTVIAGPILYLSLVDPGGRARLEQISVFRHADVSVAFLAQQYRMYISPWVFFIAGNGHPGQSPATPGFGVELRFALPLMLIGGIWLLHTVCTTTATEQRRSALLLLAALVLYPIPGSLTLPTPPLVGPNLSRAIHLIPLSALLAAIGTTVLIDCGRRLLTIWPTPIAKIALAVLFGVAATLIGQELFVRNKDYFVEYPRRAGVLHYYQYGLAEALEYAHAHEQAYDEVWVNDVNQAYIYVLFHNRWPPSDVHQNLRVRRAPPDFNQVDAIGKYRFSDAPGFNGGDLAILYAVQNPAGEIAYEVRGGETHDRRRVLIVEKPGIASEY